MTGEKREEEGDGPLSSERPEFYEYVPVDGEEEDDQPAGASDRSHFAEKNDFLERVRVVVEECRARMPGADGFTADLDATVTDPEDATPAGAAERGACAILDAYQEAPTLLDAHLEDCIAALVDPVRDALAGFDEENERRRTAGADDEARTALAVCCIDRPLRLLYHLCKVRGAKTVRRFLPHEACDLEPLVALSQAVDAHGCRTRWQTRYCLLLWLSIVVIVPFDLESIDSAGGGGGADAVEGDSPAGQDAAVSVIDAIVSLCESHLGDPGRTREAAAELVARLTTRPDMRSVHLQRFTRWCVSRLEGDADPLLATGIFAALAAIFEYGHRDELLRLMADLCDPLLEQAGQDSNDIALRKLHIKVAQRMGLIFLPPRVAPWRYQRGSRSLVGNMREARGGGGGGGGGGGSGGDGGGGSATPLEALPLMPSMGNTTAPVGISVADAGMVGDCGGGGGGGDGGGGDGGVTDASAATGNAVASGSSPGTDAGPGGGGADRGGDDDDGDVEVPEEVEAIIQRLLEGLADRDTVVRWSAAKGIGRLTNRLPLDLADDVVGAVVDLLSPDEGDSAWHGSCLALAELSRRGLLLPARLGDVVPSVCGALHYDVRRGSHSVGAHVRDAACYVAWAFARAYAPEVMAPHVTDLAGALVRAAVFDREVNVRRAASAAFQEHVGRQGRFPHGIEVLTAADYFTVGNRPRAYLSVARYVAAFGEYTRPMLDHLADVKCRHWDAQVRDLAAGSLRALAPLDPEHAVAIIERLVPVCYASDVPERHGATLAIASCVDGLSESGHWVPGSAVAAACDARVRAIVPTVEKKRLYRGRGGEVMRGAAAALVAALARARVAMPPRTAGLHLASAEESVKHPTEAISLAAVSAIAAVARSAIDGWAAPDKDGAGDAAARSLTAADVDALVARLAVGLVTDPNPGARRGYALALGALPRAALLGSDAVPGGTAGGTAGGAAGGAAGAAGSASMVAVPGSNGGVLDGVLAALITATRIEEDPDSRDAESRRNAVRALRDVTRTVGRAGFAEAAARHPGTRTAADVVAALVAAARDYTIDNRGDIGSWVREEAVVALGDVLASTCADGDAGDALAEASVRAAADAIAALTADKIDRLRERALSTFVGLLHGRSPTARGVIAGAGKDAAAAAAAAAAAVAGAGAGVGGADAADGSASPAAPRDAVAVAERLPHRAELLQLFPEAAVVDWSAPSATFPLVVHLLSLETYRDRFLASLVCSVGGLTESLVRHSRASLTAFLRGGAERVDAFEERVLEVWRVHARDDRVVIPLIKALDFLVSEGVLDPLRPDRAFGHGILDLVRGELKGCRSVPKLNACVPVVCALVAPDGGDLRAGALRALMLLLGHRYPVVRRHAADQFYTRLLVSGEDDDVASDLLLTVPWDGEDAAAREGRDTLCDHYGLPKPSRAAGATRRAQPTEFNYKDLVEEMGY